MLATENASFRCVLRLRAGNSSALAANRLHRWPASMPDFRSVVSTHSPLTIYLSTLNLLVWCSEILTSFQAQSVHMRSRAFFKIPVWRSKHLQFSATFDTSSTDPIQAQLPLRDCRTIQQPTTCSSSSVAKQLRLLWSQNPPQCNVSPHSQDGSL